MGRHLDLRGVENVVETEVVERLTFRLGSSIRGLVAKTRS